MGVPLDPMGIDSEPRVVDSLRMECLLVTVGQRVKRKKLHGRALRKRKANVDQCQLEPHLVIDECLCAEVGAVSHEQLAARGNGGRLGEWETRPAAAPWRDRKARQ